MDTGRAPSPSEGSILEPVRLQLREQPFRIDFFGDEIKTITHSQT